MTNNDTVDVLTSIALIAAFLGFFALCAMLVQWWARHGEKLSALSAFRPLALAYAIPLASPAYGGGGGQQDVA